jgi:aspartyl protease family protein
MTEPDPPAPGERPSGRMQWIILALIALAVIVLSSGNDWGRTFGLDRHELAQVAYLVVILLAVSSAFGGRRMGAGEAARAAAGWLAVLLIVIGGYAYRHELLGVGGRLLGVLLPGVPISGQLVGEPGDTVVIVRAMDGHFAVHANVDDERLTLLVDTGASFVTLTADDATRVGIDVGALRFTLPIQTANGTILTARVTLEQLGIGSIQRHDIAALVAPPNSLDQSLLGMTFLNTLKGYAISGDRLVLTP